MAISTVSAGLRPGWAFCGFMIFSSREEDSAQYPATRLWKPMYNFHLIYLISR
jgi:hypothetical protein